MIDAFKMADNVLVNAVRGISDIINIPGTVNVDFADVKTVMSNMGHSLMGIGHAAGPNRAAEAARMAISSPLLEDIDIQGATGILINITAGSSITLMEVNEACSIIQDSAHEDANIIFGAVIDESLSEAIRVTVIATGFPVDSRELDNSGPAIVRPVPARIFSPDYATGGLSSSISSSMSSATPAEATNHVTPPVLEAISEAHELAKWTIQQVEVETTPAHPAPTENAESFADYSCNEESVADDSEDSEELADSYVWEEVGTETLSPIEVAPPAPAPEVHVESGADIASRIFDSSFFNSF